MKYLKIWQKLALIGVLFLIPFAIVTYRMVASIKTEKVDFANLELLGAEYSTPLSVLLRDLQLHGTYAFADASGAPTFQAGLQAKSREIDSDIAAIDTIDQRLDPALHTSQKWSTLRQSIRALLAATPTLPADNSLARHQQVIDATVLFISDVSDNSKLTLDPDIDTYYLMNVVMFQGPATSNFLYQARSLACGIALRGATPAGFDQLSRLAILADFSQDGVADSLSRVMAFNPAVTPELGERAKASAAAVKATTDAIRNIAAQRGVSLSAAEISHTLTRNIDLLYDLQARSTQSMTRLLNNRLEHWQHQTTFTLAVAGLGLLLVSLVGLFIMRDITGQLQRVVGVANQIAAGNGNYSIRAIKRSNDELGVLIDAFNKMLRQIQAREADLKQSHDELERRVTHRTREVVQSLALVHATLESSTDGILVTDLAGLVTSFNERFLDLWLIPRLDMEGRDSQSVLKMILPKLANPSSLISKIGNLPSNKEEGSFDLLTTRDDRVLELYTMPQHVEDSCVGRVWSFRDITERTHAEKEKLQMHQRLLETSRQAGMAEVATSVLHNVGNVLNSVNVSSTLASDLVKKSKLAYLSKAMTLLKEHSADLASFLSSDPKGRQLIGYLDKLAVQLGGEQTVLLAELHSLHEKIEHIRDIVTMQQSHGKMSGVIETLNITDLVNDALSMNLDSLKRHGVEVLRQYQDLPPMAADKHKILQILVNLVRNAKIACDDSPRPDKRLTVRVARRENIVGITVSDNGVGIPPENLTRIFGHGFTTRKNGHGFGLHNSALAAKEMGGSLEVQSDGPGLGASFTLELPCPSAESSAPAGTTPELSRAA